MKETAKYGIKSGVMAVALVALFGATAVQGAVVPIPIVAPGFEVYVGSQYGAFTGGAQGWTGTGSEGQMDAASFVRSGLYSAYMEPTSTLTETLASTWDAGTFTLNGFAMTRTFTSKAFKIQVELLSGATVLASQTDYLNPSGALGPLVYVGLTPVVAAISGGDPVIGTPITIRFTSLSDTFTDQGYLDDISLDFVGVPEPSSVLLLVSGSAVLCYARKKKA